MKTIQFIFTALILVLITNLNAQTTFSSELLISDNVPDAKGIEAIDMNNDGTIDIVYTDNTGIYWQENDGAGNFIATYTITDTINNILDIHSSYIDNDNDIDIIAVSSNDSCLVWFENINQGASFIPHVLNNDADAAYSVFSVDIDNDNNIDIIYSYGTTLSFFLSNGNGTFQTEQIISDTTSANYICADDLTNDNNIDIFCADFENGEIVWFKNLGSGNFTSDTLSTFVPHASSVNIADIDGDGIKDVLATGQYDPQEVMWFKNISYNNFTPKINIDNINPLIQDAYPADYDNDGDNDIIVGAFDYIYFYENQGDGTFNPEVNLLFGYQYAHNIRPADIDNDGDIDFFASLPWQNKVIWQRNKLIPSPLIASYPFSGNANDVTGNGYDGNTTGHAPTLTTDRFGNANSAYKFDGVNTYTENDNMNLDFPFSFSGWVNINEYNYGFLWHSDMWHSAGINYYGFAINIDSQGKLGASFGDGHGTGADFTRGVKTSDSLSLNTWYHTSVIYYAYDSICVYFNGVKVPTNPTGNSTLNSVSFYNPSVVGGIGAAGDYAGAVGVFNGKIDDIQLYSQELNPTQIDSLYHLNGWTTKTNCEVVNYQLNGNTDDISGNYYHGIFVGTPQLTEDRNYNPNSAYSFDTSSYMIYTQTYDLGLNNDLSYSAWLNIDTLINDTNIFTFVFDTINHGTTIFGVGVVKDVTNELIFAHDIAANSPEIINSGFYLNPHTNYHIVVIRDATNYMYSLYVNNMKIDDYTYGSPVMNTGVNLQGITINAGDSSMAINAIIDDVIIYNCLIDEETIDSLFHIGGYTNNDNCQVVNWHLDGDSIDISGNNYDGMFFEPNPQFTEDRFGNPNSAYLVDTANGFIYGGNYDLALQNSFSYSLWLNVDTLINDTCIVSFIAGDEISDLIFALLIQNDSLYIMHNTIDSSVVIATNYVIEHNQFNHIVINRDNDSKEYSLYVNNQLEDTYTYYANPHDTIYNTQGISLSFPETVIGFNGIIDDVIVYNCLIDSTTIDSLYNIGNWLCNDFSIDSVDVTDAACGLLNGSGEVYVSGGSGFYSYLWSNGDTLYSTDSLIAGTNSIMVIDTVYGCSTTSYFTIQNYGTPVIELNSTDVLCYGGNNASINSTIISGTYEYNWSTGEHSPNITNLFAGTYELTVIDENGCIAIQSIEVTQPDELTLSFTTTNSTCGASDGSATAIVTGGTPNYNYSWGIGTNEILAIPAGAYSLTVTDDNSCVIIGSAMLSDNGAPTITLDSITPASCGVYGQVYVTIGNTTSPTYEWNGTSVANTDNLMGWTFDPSNTLTVHEGNCTAMEDFYIPYTLPNPQEICIVTVDSLTGANLVVWEKPVSTIIDGYMIYRETSIADEYMQIGYTTYNDLGVYVDSMAYPWIRSYKYKIAAKDFCDMVSEKSEAHKTIHVNLNLGYLSNTVNLIWDDYEGFPYTSFNILRFDSGTGWNDVAGSPLPNTLHSISADVLMTTSMFAITVDKPGTACLATKTSGGPYNQSISNIDDYGIGTIIESVKKQGSFNIYPNPADDFVKIESSENINTIKITDISGQIIFEKNINSKSFTIDLNNYTKGIYIINLYSKDNISIRKLVVE